MGLYDFYVQFSNSLFDEPELFSQGIRDIHIPAFDIGSSVIDYALGHFPIFGIDQPHLGSKALGEVQEKSRKLPVKVVVYRFFLSSSWISFLS